MFAAADAAPLALGVPGFDYSDLYLPDRLRALYERWHDELERADPSLAARYDAHRADAPLAPEVVSALLVDVAPHVSAFVARLFGAGAAHGAARRAVDEELRVFRFKDELVRRRASRRTVTDEATARREGERVLARAGLDGDALDDERRVAAVVCGMLDREAELKKRPPDDAELVALRAELAAVEGWLVARRAELSGRWLSLRFAHPMPPPLELVQLRRPNGELPELAVGPEEKRRARDGFKLTDRRMSPAEILAQVDYCLYCHDRAKDSCSTGLRDAKTGTIKVNALGVPLDGCPLDEKISEMHLLKRRGDSLAALALVCIDNPMLPGTGHRICNDCMKSCIYQKQEPVNIPQIETAVLTDVLALPFGFEMYALLTRWNPLNVRRPYPLEYRGKDILIVGMGPAGYTLAHHLINEGFGVVGIDGLKIEPLPVEIAGDPTRGIAPRPIRDFQFGELDERILLGFGGVSEYGITVRWDKNFLQVVYAVLARRDKFRCYGGVRLGGTLTLDDAWALGFQHVAIAVGAGKPTLIDMENNLIRGVRKASDFLMALQLTGAYKRSSLANLQVRLPALVIGGGLTAIDAATELLAYYVVQAEKTLERHDRLVALYGADHVRDRFDPEEREILDELLDHGRQIQHERAEAAAAGRAPDFQPLLDAWGGVAIVYRKRLTDSPAYRLNHEEVEKCLEEGVRFIECLSPVRVIADEEGAARALAFERQEIDAAGRWSASGELVELPARTVCVAAGTSPNTIYEKEFPGTFKLDKKGFFAPHRARAAAGGTVELTPDPEGFFTSYNKDGRVVSYYGDNHPRFAGSVVKAMASAKRGFHEVAALFADEAPPRAEPGLETAWRQLTARLDDELRATVAAVNRLTPTIVEVVVRAPRAARRFHPGQFYRLQNYESLSALVDGTRLAMEGLALTGAWTDPEAGLLSLIVLEMGGSSRLCAALKPGEPVVVMGPTGAPTELAPGATVVLAGGGLGNAVLFSIGKALRAAGSRVIYFAAYRKREDIFKIDDIEAASDEVIWSVDAGEPVTPRRARDRAFVGNVVQAMVAYAEGHLGGDVIPLSAATRLIAIGSDRMMRAVKEARHGVLATKLSPSHVGVASINSPMQCMMKEVCAQCLQKHVDPRTGKESFIFSCFNQDQLMDEVDFPNLAARLRANTVQEKLTNLWLDKLLAARDIRRV
jgi:NADPH-dependent glutamate synthase beta subunit-like oxidoreductase/NAD(P)H-flavin reductase